MVYEIYLYTLMTLVWDLDKDTHDYFRQYLNIFINHRKTSMEIREFVNKTFPRGKPFRPHSLNPLRIGLPNRILLLENDNIVGLPTVGNWLPTIIDKIHKEKYYLAGIEGKSLTNGGSAPEGTRIMAAPYEECASCYAPDKATIHFEMDDDPLKIIQRYCKKMGKKLPYLNDKHYYPDLSFMMDRVPEIYCLMRLEDS